MSAFNLYEEVANSKNKPVEISNDKQLEKELAHRSRTYSRIISIYTDYLKKSLNHKIVFKAKVSQLVLDVMILIVVFTLFVLFVSIVFDNVSLKVIISSIVSFITAFIALPKIIVSYAFNKEEEKYISEVMKSLLTHDASLKYIIQDNHRNEDDT